MDIKVEDIVVDPKLVDRTDGLDFVTVQTYADDMESGAIFPAVEIVSDSESSWLVDGQHRLAAAKQLEHETISANVTEGSYRNALLMSCSTNAEHGKPRTNEDKRQKVMMLLNDDEWKSWSSVEIAKNCKVSHTFVNKLRDLTCNVSSEKTERTYVTKHGTLATMNTTNIGKNDSGLLVQAEIEPIIAAEAAYEEKIMAEHKEKALKQRREDLKVVPLGVRYRGYLLTLLKASTMAEKLVEDFDPDEIQAFFLDNIPKYQRTKNVLTKQFDFLKLTMGGIENEFD